MIFSPRSQNLLRGLSLALTLASILKIATETMMTEGDMRNKTVFLTVVLSFKTALMTGSNAELGALQEAP